jgi:hypothetical protein
VPEPLSDSLDAFPLTPAPLPFAREIPFAAYNNKYAGQSCFVIGRGPTEFDYNRLADVSDPVFFINDAICLEKYTRAETFFFAHDGRMRIWLDGSIRATAVLPVDGKIPFDTPGDLLQHRGNVVYYHWREMNKRALLNTSREQLSCQKTLFLHSGTIHPLLHFVWYCGFAKVNLVGCDGINSPEVLADQLHAPDGYDSRLQNRSLTKPSWTYTGIRRAQDLLMALFGLEAHYLGTPKTG